LSKTIPFKLNDTDRVDIDQDNVLRRIVMLFRIVLTTPAAMTAGTTPIQDDILNAIKKIRLVLSEDENKFNVDALKWHIVETIEKGTLVKRDALSIPAAGASTTMDILLNADFATRRQDLSEITALLDAPNESSLKLEVDWGSISDILAVVNDTVIDTTNTKVFINLVEVFDTDVADPKLLQEELIKRNAIPQSGFLNIREGISRFNVTAAKSSYDDDVNEQSIDPTPSNILTHLLLTIEDITNVTGTKVRANDIITQLKVENVKGAGEKILQSRFDIQHFGNKSEYAQESLFTGALYLDWIDQRRGGLINVVADALKWRFLQNAPAATETDVIDLFTRYVPSTRS
jgi:hypothetical protein